MSMMLKAIVSVVVLLVTLLYGLPVIHFLQYRYGAWSKRTAGVKMPAVNWSVPQGIPWYRRISNGMKNNNVYRVFQQFRKEAGARTLYQQVPGRFMLYTCEPENLKAMMSTQFTDFSLGQRLDPFYPLLGKSVFTLDGPGWSHSRALLRPQFSRERISHLETCERNLQVLMEIIKSSPTEYTDLQDLFLKFMMDNSTEFLFGEPVRALSGDSEIPLANKFSHAFDSAQSTMMLRMRAQNFYWLIDSKEFRENCQICKDFVEYYIKLALERSKSKKNLFEKSSYVFLDELVKETQDLAILRDQVLSLLLAGRDTTSSVLAFVFYQFALHKDVFLKLRNEILNAFGTSNENITFESLKRLEYLRSVINETMRLYPTVATNARKAKYNTTLPRGGGPDEQSPIFVPKGTIISFSIFDTHRIPEFWGPDFEEFRPERWSEPRPNSHSWDFLPFNGGPRICLGQQYALTEASYTIVRLLQSFRDIEAMPGNVTKEPQLKAGLSMRLANGIHVKLTPADEF